MTDKMNNTRIDRTRAFAFSGLPASDDDRILVSQALQLASDFADAETQQLQLRIAELEVALARYDADCDECGRDVESHETQLANPNVCDEFRNIAREALNKQHSPKEK